MFDVTIYIETSFRGPSIRKAAGSYLIEFVLKNGQKVTRQGMVCRKSGTENALALEALTIAFSRLTKTCSVRVNTECEHILNSVQNFWIPQWEKNDWRTAKGHPVKNLEYWKMVAEAGRKHLISYGHEHDAYKVLLGDYMERGIRELETGQLEKVIYEIDLENDRMERKWEENV